MAARLAAHQLRLGNPPGPLGVQRGASKPGLPWMPGTFGADSRILIEIAPGAVLTDSEETWPWQDVTEDVFCSDGIDISVGRSDEASSAQPATCSMVLDNRDGKYSLGVSPFAPYLRRNVPVRVRLDPGNGIGTAFLGYADGWSPAWDTTGDFATVELSASGTIRRLLQGKAPLRSVMRRFHEDSIGTDTAYWTLEDGQDSEFFAASIGGREATYTGDIDLASSSVFDCSDPLPTLNGGTILAAVPAYTAQDNTGLGLGHQVRVLMAFPDSAQADGSVLFRVYTSGTAARWDIVYDTLGRIERNTYDAGGNFLSGGFISTDPIGTNFWFELALFQNGSNVDFYYGLRELFGSGHFSVLLTLGAYTIGNIVRVEIDPAAALDGVAVGHLAVSGRPFQLFGSVVQDELDSYLGESPRTRFGRLCGENGVTQRVENNILDTDTFTFAVDDMGTQRTGVLMDLLTECETADLGGMIYDGKNAGLTMVAHRRRWNQQPAITLDMTDLLPPFDPVDDDQQSRNKVTAARRGGTKATVEDSTGDLGTTAIGIYDEQTEYVARYDADMPHAAGWGVRFGTIAGYRHPELRFALHLRPDLAHQVLALHPGKRIDITDVTDARTQVVDATIKLSVEGYKMHIDQTTWTVTCNTSPYEPWTVIELQADSGTPGEFAAHLDTDGSTLAVGVAAGATSLSVATTDSTSPLWTTTASDCPFTIDIAGLPVEVTAVAGASSPQTFTVTGADVTRNLPAGLPVRIYQPPALAV